MKNLLFSVFATLGLSTALAAPTATVGSVVQEDGTGRVTITYDLSEEAIVTSAVSKRTSLSVGAAERKLSRLCPSRIGSGPVSVARPQHQLKLHGSALAPPTNFTLSRAAR